MLQFTSRTSIPFQLLMAKWKYCTQYFSTHLTAQFTRQAPVSYSWMCTAEKWVPAWNQSIKSSKPSLSTKPWTILVVLALTSRSPLCDNHHTLQKAISRMKCCLNLFWLSDIFRYGASAAVLIEGFWMPSESFTPASKQWALC